MSSAIHEHPRSLRPVFTRPLSLLNALDYGRLLYSVFFNFDWLHEYASWCAGDQSAATGWAALRLLPANTGLRALGMQALLISVALALVLATGLEFAGMAVVDYTRVAFGVSVGVVVGVVVGMALAGIDLAVGVAFGVAASVVGGVTTGIVGGVEAGVVAGAVLGAAFLNTTGESCVGANVALGVAIAAALCVALSVVNRLGVIAGLAMFFVVGLIGILSVLVLEHWFKPLSLYKNLAIGFVYLLAVSTLIGAWQGWLVEDARRGWLNAALFGGLFLRLPLYPIECAVAFMGARRIHREREYDQALAAFRRFFFDWHLFLPLPREALALRHLAQLNRTQGLADTVYLARCSNHLLPVAALRHFAGRDPYRVYWEIGAVRTALLDYVFDGQPTPTKIRAACDALAHGLRRRVKIT